MMDNEFKTVAERVVGEKTERMKRVEKMLPFGVSFLDGALSGILPNDLVLIGAPTGAGKTEMVTQIALSNALRGRKVQIFALEAEPNEIELRIKYKRLAYYHNADPLMRDSRRPTYSSWYLGNDDDILGKYEEIVDVELRQITSLQTYYRDTDFTLDIFEKVVLAYSQNVDLIVIDHIHYFDIDDRDENRGFSKVMKTIRDLSMLNRTPVVLVSHLRKSDRLNRALVPNIDDFHGTSNIAKIATKVITMAPGLTKSGGSYETYIRVCKNRMDSSSTKFIGRCTYDISLNQYDESYSIGQLSTDEKDFIGINDPKITPPWAKRALLPYVFGGE